MTFDGKVVLVAGGTRGIGLNVTRSLTAAGATCYITGRNIADGEAAQKALGENCIYVRCDATDEADVASLFDRIRTGDGRLDHAVNCLGVTGNHKAVREVDVPAWTHMLTVNLVGPLVLMRDEIRMIEAAPGGSIVNVSSCAGLLGAATQSAYSASKAALNMLTQVAALECATSETEGRYPVRINAVCPGPTLGGMNSEERQRANPESTRRKIQITALKRFAAPEEITASILFLLGEGASYMTGTVLPVDGGFSTGKF